MRTARPAGQQHTAGKVRRLRNRRAWHRKLEVKQGSTSIQAWAASSAAPAKNSTATHGGAFHTSIRP